MKNRSPENEEREQVDMGVTTLQEGESRAFVYERHCILISNIQGVLHAIDDRCNHAGCLLSKGWREGNNIVCPCHEVQFDVQTGKKMTAETFCGDQKTFPITTHEGHLLVSLPRKKTVL